MIMLFKYFGPIYSSDFIFFIFFAEPYGIHKKPNKSKYTYDRTSYEKCSKLSFHFIIRNISIIIASLNCITYILKAVCLLFIFRTTKIRIVAIKRVGAILISRHFINEIKFQYKLYKIKKNHQ